MFNAMVVLNQLAQCANGAHILKVMINGKSFVRDDKKQMVAFRFMNGAANKSNYIRITLNSMDTYDVEFGRIWGTNFKTISTHDGIYEDMLKSLFESETALALRL